MRLSKSNKKDLKDKETTLFTGLGNENHEENSIAGISSKNKKSFQ